MPQDMQQADIGLVPDHVCRVDTACVLACAVIPMLGLCWFQPFGSFSQTLHGRVLRENLLTWKSHFNMN